jgi:hypothetical protein
VLFWLPPFSKHEVPPATSNRIPAILRVGIVTVEIGIRELRCFPVVASFERTHYCYAAAVQFCRAEKPLQIVLKGSLYAGHSRETWQVDVDGWPLSIPTSRVM